MKSFLKRILKPGYHAAIGRLREWRVRSSVRGLRRAPPSVDVMMPIVTRLREAWGNPGWTADLGFLEAIVRRALGSPGPFLECGSGLSTVILGILAERNNTTVWSLEQNEEWADLLRKKLVEQGISTVHVVHAPLEVRNGAAWYRFDDSPFPLSFPLVLCDGPAVGRSAWPEAPYLAWRSGAVTELRCRGITFESLVLDDADNPRCPSLVDRWRKEGLLVEVVDTPFGPYVIATRPGADQTDGQGEE